MYTEVLPKIFVRTCRMPENCKFSCVLDRNDSGGSYHRRYDRHMVLGSTINEWNIVKYFWNDCNNPIENVVFRWMVMYVKEGEEYKVWKNVYGHPHWEIVCFIKN